MYQKYTHTNPGLCILWHRNDISKKQIKNTIGFPSGAHPSYNADVFKTHVMTTQSHVDRRKPTGVPGCDHKTLEKQESRSFCLRAWLLNQPPYNVVGGEFPCRISGAESESAF